jgi:phosphoglycerate kinase
MAKKRSILDLAPEQLRGRRALVRVDFNVPFDKDGVTVSDDTRLRAAVPTIEKLRAAGARVVLLSHLGRPKAAPDPKYSLKPVATALAGLIDRATVTFCSTTDDDTAVAATQAMADGDVLLMENTRFLPGEETNDEALSQRLARLGDVYVNDAFGSAHRAHASTAGVAKYLRPAVSGLLMEKELTYLGNALDDPRRPFVAILGGSKISGKIDVVEALLPKVDALLVGGAMACTFFKAQGLETGKSLVEPDRLEMAEDLIERSGTILILPHDATVAKGMDQPATAHSVKKDAIPSDEAMLDIGPDTAQSYARAILSAKTVLWNGPMGVFETTPFDAGTRAIATAMAAATGKGATTIVGGGDSAAAVMDAGLGSSMSHVSTGGGASLEFLEGKDLPGVSALDDA